MGIIYVPEVMTQNRSKNQSTQPDRILPKYPKVFKTQKNKTESDPHQELNEYLNISKHIYIYIYLY